MRRIALCGAVLVLAGCGGSGGGADDQDGPERVQTTTTKVEVVRPAQGGAAAFDPETIFSRDAPGVVKILALNGEGDSLNGGVGSGFVLNGEGEILTNAHVVTIGEDEDIQEVEEVYVDFADGNRVPAEIQGFDPDADIALIKINPRGLTLRPLKVGDSEKVRVGQPVAAIGSPFGEDQSLSSGIVSAVDRDVESLTDFRISGAIQTDAAINPGNSGGPLVDASGAVLGVNQQIQTESGSNSGVGFAVPINLAMRSVDQIRENGETEYAFLGVTTTPVYPQLADNFDLPVDRGAWVQSIEPDSPADEASVRAGSGRQLSFQGDQQLRAGGDVITKLDRFPIENPTDLSSAVALLTPGETVDMVLYRGQQERTIKVKLARRPE